MRHFLPTLLTLSVLSSLNPITPSLAMLEEDTLDASSSRAPSSPGSGSQAGPNEQIEGLPVDEFFSRLFVIMGNPSASEGSQKFVRNNEQWRDNINSLWEFMEDVSQRTNSKISRKGYEVFEGDIVNTYAPPGTSFYERQNMAVTMLAGIVEALAPVYTLANSPEIMIHKRYDLHNRFFGFQNVFDTLVQRVPYLSQDVIQDMLNELAALSDDLQADLQNGIQELHTLESQKPLQSTKPKADEQESLGSIRLAMKNSRVHPETGKPLEKILIPRDPETNELIYPEDYASKRDTVNYIFEKPFTLPEEQKNHKLRLQARVQKFDQNVIDLVNKYVERSLKVAREKEEKRKKETSDATNKFIKVLLLSNAAREDTSKEDRASLLRHLGLPSPQDVPQNSESSSNPS